MPLNPPMRYSLNGLHLTEHWEQCRLVAYWDSLAKIWTIGWGHTAGVKQGDTCTQPQADAWLWEDILHSALMVNLLVQVPLTQNEFDALTDFVFNVGSGNFKGSTLLRYLNAKEYSMAALQFDRWDFVAGKQCAGLLRRREAEESCFNAANPN